MSEYDEKPGETPREADPAYIDKLLSQLREDMRLFGSAEEQERQHDENRRQFLSPTPVSEPTAEIKTVTEPAPAPLAEPFTPAEPEEDVPPIDLEEAAEEATEPEADEPPFDLADAAEEAEKIPPAEDEPPFDLEEPTVEAASEPAEPAPEAPAEETAAPQEETAATQEESEEPQTVEPAPTALPTEEASSVETPAPTFPDYASDSYTRQKTEEWEAITLDDQIDSLIAESREREEPPEEPTPLPTPEAATEDLFSILAVPEAPKPSGARCRRFRLRLLRRSGEPTPVEPVDIGEVSPLLTSEEEPKEERVGTMRPQDFFIADLRSEEDPASVGQGEYVSRNQIETVFERYETDKRRYTLRFAAVLLLSLLLAAFENLPLFGVQVTELFGISVKLAVLVDCGFLAVVLLLATDLLTDGVRELFALELGVNSFVVLSAAAALLNALFAFFEVSHAMLCLPAVLAVAFALWFRGLRTRDEMMTFSHLCESGDKLALESIPAGGAPEEAEALDRRVRDIVRIKKIGFADGYFRRTNIVCDDFRLHGILALCGVGAALVLTILYLLLVPAGERDGFGCFFWLAISLVGITPFAARRLPFHALVKRADARGTAVIGESSAEEYARIPAISFEDVEAYPSRKVRIKRIKMYEGGQLDEVLYYMASVFSQLGGPLDGIFRVSAKEVGISSEVQIRSAVKDGVEATVDGIRTEIGKLTYFNDERILPYYESADSYQEECGNFSVMFAAVNGEIVAKFYLEYAISTVFERIARRLRRGGVSTLIRTYDPNIGDSLIQRTAHTPDFPTRTVKKRADQLYDFAEARLDSGIVTAAGSKDLVYALFYCQDFCRAVKVNRWLKILSLPLTLLFGLLYLVGGGGIYSIYAAAAQIVWLLPIAVVTKLYFRKER